MITSCQFIRESCSPKTTSNGSFSTHRLEIFLPHRHQCGLAVHVGRLRDSLSLPSAEQRHPALMHAIFLWACYLSRPGSLSQSEQLYLARTTAALGDALQYTSKAVDLIQACCLLSVYYISNGRLLEGSYYSAAASTLAVQCRLHQIGSENQLNVLDNWDASFELPVPKDNIERGERITTFWQVYNLDRCWSVMLRRPATLPDSDHPWASITTPWPQRIEDYENVSSCRSLYMIDFLTSRAYTGRARRQWRFANHSRIFRAASAVYLIDGFHYRRFASEGLCAV